MKSKSNSLHRSINMALRYMKEIREKYIKSFLTKKEKILDVQDAMEHLDNPRVLYEVLDYEYGLCLWFQLWAEIPYLLYKFAITIYIKMF